MHHNLQVAFYFDFVVPIIEAYGIYTVLQFFHHYITLYPSWSSHNNIWSTSIVISMGWSTRFKTLILNLTPKMLSAMTTKSMQRSRLSCRWCPQSMLFFTTSRVSKKKAPTINWCYLRNWILIVMHVPPASLLSPQFVQTLSCWLGTHTYASRNSVLFNTCNTHCRMLLLNNPFWLPAS